MSRLDAPVSLNPSVRAFRAWLAAAIGPLACAATAAHAEPAVGARFAENAGCGIDGVDLGPLFPTRFHDQSASGSWAAGSPAKQSMVADVSVWLECSGELIDVGSVDVLRIREAKPGIELVDFVCPRCQTPHSSLRFA
jgi:hypothetical protein